MAGLSLNMGGFGGGGYESAAVPVQAAPSPQGPATIGQRAFGISLGGGGSQVGVTALLSVGTLSLIGLIWIWYSLPR